MRQKIIMLWLLCSLLGTLSALNKEECDVLLVTETEKTSHKAENFNTKFLSFSNCVDDLHFTMADSPIGTGTYSAADSLTTTGDVTVNGADNVTFEAGTVIILRPGFSVQSTRTGTFTARIEACTVSGNAPPTLSFVSPMDGQIFTEGDNLNVQISANDSDGSVVGVEFFYDNISQGVQMDPYNWMINNLTEGQHTLSAFATDDDGATAQVMISITVNLADNGDPTVTISTPPDGQEFIEGDDLSVMASATDPNGSISNIRLLFDGSTVRVIQGDQGTWDASTDSELANLQIGTHQIRVVAVDNQGNTGEKNITIEVLAAGSPSLSFVTPTEGQIFPNGSDVAVEVAASDANGSIDYVDLLLDDVLVRRESSAPYEWGLSTQSDPLLENMTPGTYTLEAIAADNQGNTRSTSIVFVVAMTTGGGSTNMPPSVSFLSPTDGQTFPQGTNLSVEATASDSDGSVVGVEFFYDGISQGTDNTAPYEWTINPLASGMHVLQVVATDDDGVTAQQTINITGESNAGSPIVSFITPTDGQEFIEGADVVVEVDASDPDGSISFVDLFLDDVLIRRESIAPYEWGLSTQNDTELANMSPGTYTLEAIATDNDGNTTSEMISFTVLQGPNDAPSVSFVNPMDGDTFTEGVNLNVQATASDTDGTVTGVEFFYDGVSQGTDNTAPYEWTVMNLVAGTRTLQVVATDDDGDTAQETIMITVNVGNGDPIVIISTPADGANFPVGTDLTVMASATDPDGVKNIRLILDGNTVRVIQGDMGTWDASTDSELANLQAGSYEIKVAAVDNNNNVGETIHNITVGSSANEIENRSAGISSPIVSWSVYPNPTQSVVHLDLSNYMDEKIRISLKDQIGRTVMVRTLKATHNAVETLDFTTHIQTGLYLLTIETAELVSSKKLIFSDN